MLKIICAWCRKDLGERDGEGVNGTSHSLCLACKAKYMTDLMTKEDWAAIDKAAAEGNPVL